MVSTCMYTRVSIHRHSQVHNHPKCIRLSHITFITYPYKDIYWLNENIFFLTVLVILFFFFFFLDWQETILITVNVQNNVCCGLCICVCVPVVRYTDVHVGECSHVQLTYVHTRTCIWRAELGVRYFPLLLCALDFRTQFPTKHGAHLFGWAA